MVHYYGDNGGRSPVSTGKGLRYMTLRHKVKGRGIHLTQQSGKRSQHKRSTQTHVCQAQPPAARELAN